MTDEKKGFRFRLGTPEAPVRKPLKQMPAPGSEPHRAHRWRNATKLSRRELAERTGYSESSIAAFERGNWEPGKPIDAKAMQTYRLACAAVALGIKFDWAEASVEVGSIHIMLGPAALAAEQRARSAPAEVEEEEPD